MDIHKSIPDMELTEGEFHVDDVEGHTELPDFMGTPVFYTGMEALWDAQHKPEASDDTAIAAEAFAAELDELDIIRGAEIGDIPLRPFVCSATDYKKFHHVLERAHIQAQKLQAEEDAREEADERGEYHARDIGADALASILLWADVTLQIIDGIVLFFMPLELRAAHIERAFDAMTESFGDLLYGDADNIRDTDMRYEKRFGYLM